MHYIPLITAAVTCIMHSSDTGIYKYNAGANAQPNQDSILKSGKTLFYKHRSSSHIASLKLKWAFAFPDATTMRTKPAVIGDWLLVGGQFGEVFALHRNTGKIGWQFSADAAVRGAITVIRTAHSMTAFFADFSTNVYALDVRTGKLLWKQRAGFDPQSATTGS